MVDDRHHAGRVDSGAVPVMTWLWAAVMPWFATPVSGLIAVTLTCPPPSAPPRAPRAVKTARGTPFVRGWSDTVYLESAVKALRERGEVTPPWRRGPRARTQR